MLAWLRSFLEESPGVNSSARLIALTLTVYAGIVVAAVVWYVVHGAPSSAVIDALALVLAALVVNGAVAIIRRNGG